MNQNISKHAVIDKQAHIASDVEVGAFSVISGAVKIGTGCKIGSHVVIQGPTKIGKNNTIYQFVSLGGDPQDKSFAGEKTELCIGDNNVIREYVSIHRGSAHGTGITRIGDNNFIMAYCHIAHDCQIGNHIIMANSSSLAGHVLVEDYAIMSGFVLVHQFCRIGSYSFCAMGSGIAKDVPPYIMVAGEPGKPRGLNREGLKRRNFSPDLIKSIKKAYKLLYKEKLTLGDALIKIKIMGERCPEVCHLATFVEGSSRSIVR